VFKLVISNRKGGTGKTTVSVNLAAELAAAGKRVLLIDLDSQGHCAVGLGLKLASDSPTIHDLFSKPGTTLSRTIHQTDFANLSIAPADGLFEHGSGLRDARLLLNGLSEPEIASRYDVVIMDTPPSHDVLLLNALTAANFILVPFVPHPLSYEGLRQLMRVLFKVISRENRALKIAGFLPVMSSNQIRQHHAIKSDVGRQFGSSRVMQGIRNDIQLAEAFAVGKPIRYYAPKSRGAKDFANLAQAILEKMKSHKVTGPTEIEN